MKPVTDTTHKSDGIGSITANTGVVPMSLTSNNLQSDHKASNLDRRLLIQSDDCLLQHSYSLSPSAKSRSGFGVPSFYDNHFDTPGASEGSIGQYNTKPSDTLSDSDYSTRSRDHGSHTEASTHLPHTVGGVANQIRCSFAKSAQDDQYFLPCNKLREIINIEAVRDILHDAFSTSKPSSDIDRLSFQILGKALRQKIFAILVIINKVHLIDDLIKGGIEDGDLPLVVKRTIRNNSVCQELCKRSTQLSDDECLEPIKSLSQWSFNDMEAFGYQQRLFCIPIFEVPGEERPFFDLKHRPTLPFLQFNQPLSGGYGTVRKVMIHESHYIRGAACKIQKGKGETYFAVKELNSTMPEAYEEEMKLFDKLSGQQNHPKHLIQLRFSYFHADHYYLAFPWADGNLREFWAKVPKFDPWVKSDVIWLFTQCIGLVRALQKIHYVISISSRIDDLSNASNDKENIQVWGRHGDLKPENILWLQTDDNMQNFLVISDFGLTRFNSAKSKSTVPPDGISGYSGTYRPPEIDLRSQISPRYDIWSLGCVFLEFVSWFLLGYAETQDSFTTLRLEDENEGRVREDKFFVITGGTDVPRRERQASLKPAVIKWIEKLHQDENCTEPLHIFLDLIESRMLQAVPTERFKCGEIAIELEALRSTCEANEAYATRRKADKRNPSRFPTLYGSSKNDSDACQSSDTATNTVTIPATKPISGLLRGAFSLAITKSLRSIFESLRRILALPRLWQAKRVSEALTSC